MSNKSLLTGAPYPAGGDDGAQIDDIFMSEFDPWLAPRVVLEVPSLSARNAAFPSLGTSSFPKVRITGLGEEHQWDGKQWLVYDIRPKPLTFLSNSYLYTRSTVGGSLTPFMTIGQGTWDGWFQRRGWWVDWAWKLTRGSDTPNGSGYFTLYLPFPVASTGEGGWSRCRQGQDMYLDGGVWWEDTNHPVMVAGGSRVTNTSANGFSTGDSYAMGGTCRLGGSSLSSNAKYVA